MCILPGHIHTTDYHVKFEELLISLIQLIRFILFKQKSIWTNVLSISFWLGLNGYHPWHYLTQEHCFKEHWGMNRYVLLPTYSKWISMHINMRNPTYSQGVDEQVFSPFKITEAGRVRSDRNSIEQLIQSVTF